MKAPEVMQIAVARVEPKRRLSAAKLAEKTFFSHYTVNLQDGEFTESQCIEMAALAAAAEVEYFYG